MKIGLVELPHLKLIDPNGTDWTEQNQHPLISKQILMATLEAGGVGWKSRLFYDLHSRRTSVCWSPVL
jgi:hypothetical protein